jgi:hypothetical protein
VISVIAYPPCVGQIFGHHGVDFLDFPASMPPLYGIRDVISTVARSRLRLRDAHQLSSSGRPNSRNGEHR